MPGLPHQNYEAFTSGKGRYDVVLDAGEESLLLWYGKWGVTASTAQQLRRMVMPMAIIRKEIVNRLA